MVGSLHKPPRGKCVLVVRNWVQGGREKVDTEMFNPSEEEVMMN